MTVIRLSLAFIKVWVIWHQLDLYKWLTVMYRFEMNEFTGVAIRRTTMPANADQPRILSCQLTS